MLAGEKIEAAPSFAGNLNQYYVIRLEVQKFLFQKSHLDIFIDKIQGKIIKELQEQFGDCFATDEYGLQGLSKSEDYVELTYITRIFPIERYEELVTINIFKEFSQTLYRSHWKIQGLYRRS
jgi:hypothetical protein